MKTVYRFFPKPPRLGSVMRINSFHNIHENLPTNNPFKADSSSQALPTKIRPVAHFQRLSTSQLPWPRGASTSPLRPLRTPRHSLAPRTAPVHASRSREHATQAALQWQFQGARTPCRGIQPAERLNIRIRMTRNDCQDMILLRSWGSAH